MKNAINYYYNLNPQEIHQINKKYKFENQNKHYLFEPIERNIDELKIIYELHGYLLNIGSYCHKIILNNNHQITTNINGTNYIMLQTFTPNKIIEMNDILIFSNMYIDTKKFEKIKRDNWYNLWINKIDYVEYQISQFGKKYNLIRESSDYYIGIVENCISLLVNIKKGNSAITISHNRTTQSTNLSEYFNPTTFILDSRIRDISEYFKDCIIKQIDILDTIIKYIYYNKLNIYEINLLFIRILYPSYYLDLCETILEEKEPEEKLKQIIDKVETTEDYIRKIYHQLKPIGNLPDIEWLIKKWVLNSFYNNNLIYIRNLIFNSSLNPIF